MGEFLGLYDQHRTDSFYFLPTECPWRLFSLLQLLPVGHWFYLPKVSFMRSRVGDESCREIPVSNINFGL